VSIAPLRRLLRALTGSSSDFNARAALVRETFWDAVMLVAVGALNVEVEYAFRWLKPAGFDAVGYRTVQVACLLSTVKKYAQHVVGDWPTIRRRRGRHTK
jgi:hypothetical protein